MRKAVERTLHFLFRGLVELRNVHVANAGTNEEVKIDAVARNLIANHRKLERLFCSFTQHRDVDSCALRPLQQVSHIAGVHVVSGLAIHCGDNVAGMNSRAVRRCSGEGRNHDDLVVARPDRHPYAVILATLIFPQQGIRLGIEEVGVRIEHVQHARNCTVVDGFVRIHWLSVILLDDVIDFGELL